MKNLELAELLENLAEMDLRGYDGPRAMEWAAERQRLVERVGEICRVSPESAEGEMAGLRGLLARTEAIEGKYRVLRDELRSGLSVFEVHAGQVLQLAGAIAESEPLIDRMA
jgi:hypothetical protein